MKNDFADNVLTWPCQDKSTQLPLDNCAINLTDLTLVALVLAGVQFGKL